MKIFKSRTAKLKERIYSLEQYLGAVYGDKEGYHEHVNDEYGLLPNLEKSVDKLKEAKGKK